MMFYRTVLNILIGIFSYLCIFFLLMESDCSTHSSEDQFLIIISYRRGRCLAFANEGFSEQYHRRPETDQNSGNRQTWPGNSSVNYPPSFCRYTTRLWSWSQWVSSNGPGRRQTGHSAFRPTSRKARASSYTACEPFRTT